LPILIDFGRGKVIEFTYSSGGNKLKKVVKNTGGSILYTEDYVEGIEYKNGIVEAIYHLEGRLFNNAGTWQREYSIRDHLGNTRLTYADLNNDGVIAIPSEILQENSYDPFGSSLDGVWMNHALPDNQYQYNNKELNADHGLMWLDYGARFMDPGIGRFTTIDPLTDVMRRFSTYNYAFDNPMRFIDPDGRAPEDVGNPIRTIATFLAGFSNAIASNSTGNYPGTRGNPNDFGDYATAASYGQRVGDAVSVVLGGLEMTTSAAGVTIEAILAPETGVSALAIAPTAALATVGAVTSTTALNNLLNPTKVNLNEAPKKGNRATDQTDATQQVNEISKAREKAAKERPSIKSGEWEGSNRRPKQRKIESTEKSKQREYQKNKNSNSSENL
jgi:RHS repeat-associated protein